MCIFSRPIITVASTCIFARLNPEGQQYLAYSMTCDLPEEMAMILPIPVARDSEQVLEWLDLSSCPKLFFWLEHAFSPPSRGGLRSRGGGGRRDYLEVVDVGSFEASYVPQLSDFDRLDPRFRLDTSVWAKLPQYVDYGFAVFKLKGGSHKVHPMGFRFSTRYPDQLFFPTVHVHDGEVCEREKFDHDLYCQSSTAPGKGPWVKSYIGLGLKIPPHENTKRMVDRNLPGYKLRLSGDLPNRDVLVPGAPLPDPPLRVLGNQDTDPESGLRPGLGRKKF